MSELATARRLSASTTPATAPAQLADLTATTRAASGAATWNDQTTSSHNGAHATPAAAPAQAADAHQHTTAPIHKPTATTQATPGDAT